MDTITAAATVTGLGLVKNDLIKYSVLAKKADIMAAHDVAIDSVLLSFNEQSYEAAVVALDKLVPKFRKALKKKYTKLGCIFVELDSFAGTPDNPRIDADGSGLVDLIANEGLKEPCIIDQHGVIAQGHRRKNALMMLRTVNPTAFEFWFADGVPVDQRELTKLQFIDLLCDHGSSEPLSNQYEIYASFKLLYNAGLSEGKCMERLRTAVDRVVPMAGKTLTRIQSQLNDINELIDSIADADDTNLANNLTGELNAKRTAYNTDWQSVRRGLAQYWARIARLPKEVENGFFFQCTAKERGDYIKCTQKGTETLLKAFKLDVPNGGNVLEPGEHYLTARQGFVDSGNVEDKAIKTKGKPKAQTHGSMMKPIEEGQICSDTVKNLTRLHAGFDTPVDVISIDFLCVVMEHVQATNRELWEQCVDSYTDRRKEAIAHKLVEGTAGTAAELSEDEQENGRIISQSEGNGAE